MTERTAAEAKQPALGPGAPAAAGGPAEPGAPAQVLGTAAPGPSPAPPAAAPVAALDPSELRWGPDGLLPAVVQDVRTGQVLMVAYMNEESLRRTLATGTTWFWSRSRGRLWQKGETSGHRQWVREIRTDCDGDTLLVLVDQVGVACHEGTYSCFSRRLAGAPVATAPAGWFPNAPPGETAAIGAVLEELAGVLAERRRHPDPGSYTARLLARWPDGPLKKVAEEAGEVLLAAKEGDRAAVIWEVADLWFHTLVVLTGLGISLDEVAAELARRRGRRRSETTPPERPGERAGEQTSE